MKWPDNQAVTESQQNFRDLLEFEENRARQANNIAWLCSYTPVEIISACDFIPRRMLAYEKETLRADTYLHPTLCSYVRGALESMIRTGNNGLQGAVLLNSCNAACHLYHAYAAYFPKVFHYLLDLPHISSAAAIKFWAGELRKFHHALADFKQLPVRPEDLQEQIGLYRDNRQRMAALYGERKGEVSTKGSELIRFIQSSMLLPPQRVREILPHFENYVRQQKESGHAYHGPRLLVVGSMPGASLLELIEEQGGVLVLDDLCLGRRAVSFDAEPCGDEDPYGCLASYYLTRSPCARMQDAFSALERWGELTRDYGIEGIILYCLKFCDSWYYLGQILKEKIKHVPVLVLEGEYTAGSGSGQIRTRVEAFLEMLSRRKQS
jgi:benzoyl-CoA reductase/2-hydroxyglutaryl-CoA dehydratase subunit BcrC/BadD/HgdB